MKTPEEKRRKHIECTKNWVLRNPLKRKIQNAKSNKSYYLRNKKRLLKVCRDWEKKNPKMSNLHSRRHTVKKHNIPLELFNELFRVQKGRCLGCKKLFPSNKAPSIDHNKKCCPGVYSCGECIRGLLCNSCNIGLGHAKDDIKILKNWILYLGGSL